MVSNCLLTSLTISLAAMPTDFMVMAVNAYGIIAPMRRNAKTMGLRETPRRGEVRAGGERAKEGKTDKAGDQ